MEPVLGMRFDHPTQVKMCLANYGVANRYQLWYYRNDWRKLLVCYGRDVEAGRCAGYNSFKKKKKKELGEDESLKVNKVTTKSKRLMKVQCPQRPIFAYEGGVRDTKGGPEGVAAANPLSHLYRKCLGTTYGLEDEETESSNYYFRRFYVCFKGVKEGWLACCRKVIGLDGCFLKHTCIGELLVALRRDANNQMYPIAWAVVKVENNENR
ncbi:hypothetical protein Tco_0927961 [Tanacetum coccineum]